MDLDKFPSLCDENNSSFTNDSVNWQNQPEELTRKQSLAYERLSQFDNSTEDIGIIDSVINADDGVKKEELIFNDPLEDSNLERDFGEVDQQMYSFTKDGCVKLKHKDGKLVRIWECNTCLKEFTHHYTLMRHLPTHTDERKYICNICGKAFRQMSTLSQHKAIHSTARPFVCDTCHKSFNRVSTLISHKKTHTDVKPHICPHCKKAFHQKGNLRNHIFTHTNERPYKCDICGKGFNQTSNLMCHRLKAHQRNEKPKYSCQVCATSFNKRITLRQHEQTAHKMINNNVFPQEKINMRQAIVLTGPIKTEAYHAAVELDQTSFALVQSNSEKVLSQVVSLGDHHILVPASLELIKKNAFVIPQNEDGQGGEVVQYVMRVPVVAVVTYKGDKLCQTGDKFVYSSSLQNIEMANQIDKENVDPMFVASNKDMQFDFFSQNSETDIILPNSQSTINKDDYYGDLMRGDVQICYFDELNKLDDDKAAEVEVNIENTDSYFNNGHRNTNHSSF